MTDLGSAVWASSSIDRHSPRNGNGLPDILGEIIAGRAEWSLGWANQDGRDNMSYLSDELVLPLLFVPIYIQGGFPVPRISILLAARYRPGESSKWLSNTDDAVLKVLVVIALAFVLAACSGKKGGDREFRRYLLGAKLLIIFGSAIYLFFKYTILPHTH